MGDHDLSVGPGSGDLLDLGGLGARLAVRGRLTGGAFAVVEHPVAPATVVEPHVHRHEDELTYVLEGTLWARVGDQEMELPAGSFVWKPRGVLHTFWNPGPGPVRILETISPAGFEIFFEELAALLRAEPAPEGEVDELCDRYGLSFDRSWLPGLQARFGPMRVV